jgi:hypothetical protein
MSAGLPQNFNPVATTTHFQFFVEHSVPAGAQAIATHLAAACESDYGKLLAIFAGSVPGHLPFNVYLCALNHKMASLRSIKWQCRC